MTSPSTHSIIIMESLLRACLHGGGGPQVGEVTRLGGVTISHFYCRDHVYMIGGVTRLGGLPGLPGRVTLSAGVAFCHVNDSRWGRAHVPGVEFMLHLQARQSAPNSSKVTVKSHSTEMLQREQTLRGKEH